MHEVLAVLWDVSFRKMFAVSPPGIHGTNSCIPQLMHQPNDLISSFEEGHQNLHITMQFPDTDIYFIPTSKTKAVLKSRDGQTELMPILTRMFGPEHSCCTEMNRFDFRVPKSHISSRWVVKQQDNSFVTSACVVSLGPLTCFVLVRNEDVIILMYNIYRTRIASPKIWIEQPRTRHNFVSQYLL